MHQKQSARILVGNYLGSWDINDIPLRISIEAYEDKLELYLLLNTVKDSFTLNLRSVNQFFLDNFVVNSSSSDISGELIGDTMNIENCLFLVSDPDNIKRIIKGRFARQ